MEMNMGGFSSVVMLATERGFGAGADIVNTLAPACRPEEACRPDVAVTQPDADAILTSRRTIDNRMAFLVPIYTKSSASSSKNKRCRAPAKVITFWLEPVGIRVD
jgi:hypothetical protein